MADDSIRYAFEAWERPCRGHQLWNHPVDLEPVHQSLDAIKSRQGSPRWRALYASDPLSPSALEALGLTAPPAASNSEELPVELQLVLRERTIAKPGDTSRLLEQLHSLACPLSFEVIGLPKRIIVQVCCSRRDANLVRGAFGSYFPDAKVTASGTSLESRWQGASTFVSVIDFGLLEGFHLPISRRVSLHSDPLLGVIGALGEMERHEIGVFQVVFHRVTHPWGADLWQIFSGRQWATGMLPLARAKMSEPLVAAVIRAAVRSTSLERAEERARQIGTAVIAMSRSEHNYLIPLSNAGYPNADHEKDILGRRTRRSGMVLTLSELRTFVHPLTLRASSASRERTGESPSKQHISSAEPGVAEDSARWAASRPRDHASSEALSAAVQEHDSRLTAKAAASYLGLATQTLAKMRVVGSSPPYYKVGRLVVYDRSALDAWLAARRRRSTSDGGG